MFSVPVCNDLCSEIIMCIITFQVLLELLTGLPVVDYKRDERDLVSIIITKWIHQNSSVN